MAGNRPEEQVAAPVVTQSWRDVAFLHWRVDPETVARLLPAPLEVDLVDGSAWVGLTPFRVERMRAFGAVPVSMRSTFPETNLRTYVRAPDGGDGIYFLSIDVPTVANVTGGRIAGVAYHLAA